MNTANHEVITPFYRDALTVNSHTTPAAVLGHILADNFQSLNGDDVKDKATLINQLGYFWNLVPDLKWEPKDVLIAANKVVVRSVASGSPNGMFMGIECDGSKTFKIDTIDIHELADGKIVRVHHLEDWATAIQQLTH